MLSLSIYSGIWIINHKHLERFFKHSKKFSSIFMQVRAKRDLYDTSRMIKGTSRDVEGKNSGLEFDQDLTGTSRDI